MYSHDYQQIVSTLSNKVKIYRVNTKENRANNEDLISQEVNAVWDTGAARSIIHKRLVKKGKLKPIDCRKYSAADGATVKAKIYNVSLELPDGGVFFHVLSVAAMDLPNCDFLIGMDVIGQGCFHVDKYKNKTILSYKTGGIQG